MNLNKGIWALVNFTIMSKYHDGIRYITCISIFQFLRSSNHQASCGFFGKTFAGFRIQSLFFSVMRIVLQRHTFNIKLCLSVLQSIGYSLLMVNTDDYHCAIVVVLLIQKWLIIHFCHLDCFFCLQLQARACYQQLPSRLHNAYDV